MVPVRLVVLRDPLAGGMSTMLIPKELTPRVRRTSDQLPVRSRSSRCEIVVAAVDIRSSYWSCDGLHRMSSPSWARLRVRPGSVKEH